MIRTTDGRVCARAEGIAGDAPVTVPSGEVTGVGGGVDSCAPGAESWQSSHGMGARKRCSGGLQKGTRGCPWPVHKPTSMLGSHWQAVRMDNRGHVSWSCSPHVIVKAVTCVETPGELNCSGMSPRQPGSGPGSSEVAETHRT
jgi:hypothetical protein